MQELDQARQRGLVDRERLVLPSLLTAAGVAALRRTAGPLTQQVVEAAIVEDAARSCDVGRCKQLATARAWPCHVWMAREMPPIALEARRVRRMLLLL